MLGEKIYTGKQIGDYRIIANVSSSPASSIYQAEHLSHEHAIVSIKIMHATHLSEQRRGQFLKEVQLLKKLKHAHILPILDAGIFEDMPYLITGYPPGGSLRDRIRSASTSTLPVQEILIILSQAGQALQYAHQLNIIHGNLKPENILFDEENHAFLADFSIVTTMDVFSAYHQTNTLPYMAPEQFQGWMTKESDQYALGCIAYELLTGKVPFFAPNFSGFKSKHLSEIPVAPTQLNLLLPIPVEKAVLKALEKKSENRYPSVKDFVTSLGIPAPGNTPALLKARAARQQYISAGTPLASKPPVYQAGTTNVINDVKAKPGRSDSINQYAETTLPISLTAAAQDNKEYKKPVLLDLPRVNQSNELAAGTQIEMGARAPLAAGRPVLSPGHHGGNSTSRQTWLISVGLFVVISVITFATLHTFLPSSLSLKPTPTAIVQNSLPTPTLTLAPTQKPLPTATQAISSKVAHSLSPTPTSPTPLPTSMSSPTPTPNPALTVTPTSIRAETDCQKSGPYYVCAVTLLLPQNYPGDLKWYSSAGNLSVFFNPSKGTLSPGQEQSVTAEVFTTCPHTGTLNFFSKSGEASVQWTC